MNITYHGTTKISKHSYYNIGISAKTNILLGIRSNSRIWYIRAKSNISYREETKAKITAVKE